MRRARQMGGLAHQANFVAKLRREVTSISAPHCVRGGGACVSVAPSVVRAVGGQPARPRGIGSPTGCLAGCAGRIPRAMAVGSRSCVGAPRRDARLQADCQTETEGGREAERCIGSRARVVWSDSGACLCFRRGCAAFQIRSLCFSSSPHKAARRCACRKVCGKKGKPPAESDTHHRARTNTHSPRRKMLTRGAPGARQTRRGGAPPRALHPPPQPPPPPSRRASTPRHRRRRRRR